MKPAGRRQKGNRREREIVERHKAIGVACKRVPLSGAMAGYKGDLDVDGMRAEVKARKNGAGFSTIERWLEGSDLLFLRRDRAEPLVVMPWQTYERIWHARI